MCVLSGRFREKKAMQEAKEKFKDDIERFIALQFLFDKQWKAVRVCLSNKLLQACLPVVIKIAG